MPAYFFDTSALLKRSYREPGTTWVQGIVATRARSTIYLSLLAQVETTAALRRIGRLNGDHPSYIDSLVNLFKRHSALSAQTNAPYTLIPISPSVIEYASGLCDKYWDISPGPLRLYLPPCPTKSRSLPPICRWRPSQLLSASA